jgi:hypothetical protein
MTSLGPSPPNGRDHRQIPAAPGLLQSILPRRNPPMAVKSLDYRLWMHAALILVSPAPKSGLQLYGPTVIRFLDSSNMDVNLLKSSSLITSPSFFVSLASTKLLACSLDPGVS